MLRKGPSQKNWHDYVESRLSAYIDGELPEEERVQVRRHLGECAECQASLDSLGWTIKLLKQIPAPPLPRQFTLPVPAAAPARAPSSSGWLRWSLAGISALTVLLFAFLLSKDLLFSPAAPNRVALAPAAAPVPAQPTTVAAKSQPSAGSADNSFGIQAAPTSAPAATTAPLVAAAPTMPAVAQPPAAASEVQATPATRPSRSMTQPTPTPTCEGCGAGPANTQTGLGGGTAETATPAPMMGIMGVGGAPVLPSAVATGITDAAQLNVRAAPDAAGLRLGWLPGDTRMPVVGRDSTGRWLEIIFQSYAGPQQVGWVDSQFVLLSMPVSELPVLTDEGTPVPTPTPFGLGMPAQGQDRAAPGTIPPTTAAP